MHIGNRHAHALLILFTCFAAGAGFAADFKTITGKEYKDATIKRVEPDGLVLVTQWGISKVYFSELPPNIRDRFAYEAARTGGAVPPVGQMARSEPMPVAAPREAAPRGNSQLMASPPHEIAPEHTYQITRDYVIGGDTGEVAARLKRGERYRGRVVENRAELNIGGTWCTVASDILSSPTD